MDRWVMRNINYQETQEHEQTTSTEPGSGLLQATEANLPSFVASEGGLTDQSCPAAPWGRAEGPDPATDTRLWLCVPKPLPEEHPKVADCAHEAVVIT